ncbi:MAG: mechanosensitive ion channel family protein [Xanthomonadales bacterium]|nr:mechanosensitive ion channel family protein [Xanthomonadales bacterium]
MLEYFNIFMNWVDESGPLVRVPFVVGLLLLYLLIFRFIRNITRSLSAKITREKRYALRIQKQIIVSHEDISKIAVSLVRATGLTIAIVIGFSLLNMAMGLFEQSRTLAGNLLELTLEAIGFVIQGFIDYIPSLLVIIVVLLIVRFILHAMKLVFKGIGNGSIHIPGFYSEWSTTSFNLLRMLVYALTLIIIFPYLPGSDSPAFQGLSLFLGLLLSLGSTTAVANVVAGIVLTYTRAFNLGDRVSIHDTLGVVVERGMFVTRLKNTKNEVISIPNAMTLTSHIINYSEQAKGAGLILYTSVTIGYDVPWPKVHELLISAAVKTENIETEPEPFVLQKSLDDYSVNYQLNATTKDAVGMPRTHSSLNANILDVFNAAGVEIMSPMFVATRDGTELTIPPSEQ